MKKRIYIGLLAILVANVAAVPSYGQVYKWVDSSGRVNYSGQPPADSEAAKTLKVVEANISVYTPDESLKRAVEENRQRKNYRVSSDNVYAMEGPSACTGSSPYGCQPADNGMSGYNSAYSYYPYAPGVVYGRFRRPVQLAQVQLTPGAIAGNVVGMNGYIPGLSAFAPSAQAPFARPPHISLASRGLAPR
jgi:hypothetical protein